MGMMDKVGDGRVIRRTRSGRLDPSASIKELAARELLIITFNESPFLVAVFDMF
jgi:hypothetical protein